MYIDFLKPIDCVQTYLSSVRYIEELQTFVEDQNFKQSLVIEPEDEVESEQQPSIPVENKNLLDDSDLLIEDLKHQDSCSTIPRTDEIHQCFIERRCLLKNFKKPNLSHWKKYSITIIQHYIFFYKEKSILSTIAKHFSCENEYVSSYNDNPDKCQSISDWLIVRNQTKTQNEIQLSDLNRGRERKKRVQSIRFQFFLFFNRFNVQI